MSRPVLVTGLLPALCAALIGCDRDAGDDAQDGAPEWDVATSSGESEVSRVQAGASLPAITLSDPKGETLDLAAIKGPVLVNLWATWCAPCIVEMPMLDALADELAGEVRVLTVSQDLRGAEVVEPFFAERNFTHLEPWLDPEAMLAERFGGDGQLPLTLLFDANGREVLRVEGAYEWDGEGAIALVREALERE